MIVPNKGRNAPKSSAPATCPHCGKSLAADSSPDAPSKVPADAGIDLEALAKKVLPEVMKVIAPLVEKLQEGVEQQRKELQQSQSKTPVNSEQEFQERIQSLQQAALERVKNMEQKITSRMSKLQKRTGL